MSENPFAQSLRARALDGKPFLISPDAAIRLAQYIEETDRQSAAAERVIASADALARISKARNILAALGAVAMVAVFVVFRMVMA